MCARYYCAYLSLNAKLARYNTNLFSGSYSNLCITTNVDISCIPSKIKER